MNSELDIEQHGQVLVVTINREERMNALSGAIYEGLESTWVSLQGTTDVRAIVITGAGTRAFCVGMDLKDYAERGGPRPYRELWTREMRQTPLECDLWLPTIVAVNGVCTGAGLHFVADADVVIGSTNASFIDTHVSVGQVAALEPISLVPRIGLGNALKLAVLGSHGRIDSEEAHRISLVDEVVAPDELLPRAIELGELIATNSPAAVEASKRAVRGTVERPLNDAMQYGFSLLLDHRVHHPDSLEGPRAFAEKRTPQWQQQALPGLASSAH